MSRFLFFFKSILPAFAVAVLASVLASCQPEQLNVEVVPPVEVEGDLEYVQLPVVIDCVSGDDEATKATALNAAEGRASGAMVLVFRHGATPETSLLDSYTYFTQAQIEAATPSNPLKVNVPVTTCDFYILGNLNGIHRTSGAAVNLMDALGADFPVLESDLEAMLYRLDGGAINGNYRREKMSEINTYGIPYQRIEKNVNVSNVLTTGIPNADKCIRLFSKVNLTISHAAFDGNGANPTYFTNKRLVMRQVNNRLQPFSTAPQKAAEAADVLAAAGESNEANFADYDLSMESYNASSVTVSLYVPENMQGNLLSNPASGTNNLKKIPANVAAGVRPYVTYVEYVGSIDKSAGGYGADVTYQFCLGGDAYNNFDLERGKKYDVTLGFTVNNLFAEPEWKVNLSGWTDYRLFALTADPAFSTDISSVQAERKMSVRKSRDGFAYVYMNPQGSLGQTNYLLGKDAASASGFTPSSIADCAWSGDLVTPGTADYKWLSDRGMSAVYDKITGKLAIQVVDDAKFDTYSGNALENTREFKLKLLPNGTETSFIVRMMPDITFTVADGKSLTEDFYMGQSRNLTVSGFSGSTVRYAAVQPSCGPFSDNLNHQWKLTNSMTDAFPQGGDGNTFSYSHISTGQVVYTGSALTLYAFYPNRFQSSHGWASKDGKIVFVSEDWWNDTFEVPVRISEPKWVRPVSGKVSLSSAGSSYCLPIDGNEVVTDGGFYTYDGSSRFNKSDFDPVLCSSVLKINSKCSKDGVNWDGAFELNPFTGELYIVRTTSGSTNLEDSYGDASRSYSSLSYNVGFVGELSELFGTQTISTRYSMLYVKDFEASTRWDAERSNKFGKHYQYLTTLNGKKAILTSYLSGASFSDGYNPPADVMRPYLYSPTDVYNGQRFYDYSVGVDSEIFCSFKFSFVNGKTSLIDWRTSGNSTSYTCLNPPYDVIYPVITIDVLSDDTGNGGAVEWLYKESNQVMVHNGEKVPGGLILPYGEQHIQCVYSNKWDGREFSTGYDFGLIYNIDPIPFIGATNHRYASVFMIPPKMCKYVKLVAPSLPSREARHRLLKFGPLDFSDRTQHLSWVGGSGSAFQKFAGTNDFYETLTGESRYFPISMDVKYVGGNVQSFSTGTTGPFSGYTAWSQSVLNYFNIDSRKDYDRDHPDLFSSVDIISSSDFSTSFPLYKDVFSFGTTYWSFGVRRYYENYTFRLYTFPDCVYVNQSGAF